MRWLLKMKPRFRAESVVLSEQLWILASCCWRPMSRNSVLEEFNVNRLAWISCHSSVGLHIKYQSRRIFHYSNWESVKELQYCCGRLDFNHIYFKRFIYCIRALCDLDNLVLRTCFFVFKRSQEFCDLSRDFNCIIDVFSVVELKMCVFSAR